MHTVGYAMVSTEDQAREGVSLAAQREVIGERTRDAMQHLKAQGQVYSRPVFEDAATLA
jgi:DNA invertase Pin-like site-specific DNA recombinase